MTDPRRPEREELARIIDPWADWDNPNAKVKKLVEQGAARMTADRIQNWIDNKSDTEENWSENRPRLEVSRTVEEEEPLTQIAGLLNKESK